MVKNPPADAGDMGSISGSARYSGVGNGNPLQYFCLGNPMDRGAWWVTVHGVTDMTEQAHITPHSRSRFKTFNGRYRYPALSESLHYTTSLVQNTLVQ